MKLHWVRPNDVHITACGKDSAKAVRPLTYCGKRVMSGEVAVAIRGERRASFADQPIDPKDTDTDGHQAKI